MPRVLVIDDEELRRKAIRVVLEIDGYEVIDAADGAVGLRLYREHGADLVLVDMFMPEKDGLEVIRALRTEVPRPIMIAMSGGGQSGQADPLEAAKALGAARTIVKPFQPRELLTMIRELLP